MEVIVELGEVVATGREEIVVIETDELLATTVRADSVGGTAFLCPKQMLYADAALRSYG